MPRTDPTLELLDRLKDASQWDVRRDVPVFVPHERKGRDGKLVKVDVERLKRIVRNAKRLREHRAVVPRITIGHIKPESREEDQPEFVGFADNWRLGTFGPKKIPCIVVDRYYERSCRDLLYLPDGRERYPYRSAEFYPPSDEITGVAILKRDPQLDMGLTYEKHPAGGSYFYVMGDEDMPLPDPTRPPMAPPAPGKGPLPASPPDAGDDEYTKFKGHADRYVKEHPVLGPMCHKDEGMDDDLDDEGGEPNSLGGAGPTSGTLPGPDKDKDMEPMQRQRPRTKRERELLERLRKLEARDKARDEQYARSESRRLVAKLQNQGYRISDPKKEIERMTKLSDAQRNERYDEIAEHYERAPTGGEFLDVVEDVAPDGAAPGKDPHEFGERDLEAAEEYMRKHQNDPGDHEAKWDKAQEYALAQRNKRRR